MKPRTFAGAAGFLLGIGMSAAVASAYNLDDVYRMARQAKDAAEAAKDAAEEIKDAIGSPYSYGSLAWQLRKAAECD